MRFCPACTARRKLAQITGRQARDASASHSLLNAVIYTDSVFSQPPNLLLTDILCKIIVTIP